MNKKEFIRNRPFDEVDASQMQQWTEDGMIDYVKALATDGVIMGLDVIANPGMTVKVKSGIALDSVYHLINVPTDQIVSFGAAHATYGRIDVVTLAYKTTKVDNVDTTNKYNRGTSFVYSKNILEGYELKVYAGTPSATPAVPSIPATEVKLAEVTIPSKATTPSVIKDVKKKTAMVNAVAPFKSNTAPTENLYEGMQWYNTTTKEIKIYINGAWESMNFHSHTIAQITGLQAALDSKETPTGAQAKANTAETNAKNASVPRTGGTMTGPLKSETSYNFISKMTGYKSWVMHSPTRNSLVFAPSTLADGEIFDWTKSFELTDTGEFKIPGQLTAGNGVFGGTISEGGVGLSSKYVPQTTQVVAGTGISGGGALSTNRTLSFDTTWGDNRYVNTTGSTMSGILTIARNQGRNFVLKQLDSDLGHYNYMGWLDKANTLIAYVGYDSGKSGTFVIKEYAGDVNISSGPGKVVKADGNRILTEADYGAGKGIDADSVDGVHLAGLVQTSRKVNPGTGLTGGGDLSTDRALSFDTTWGDARYANVTGQRFTGDIAVKDAAYRIEKSYAGGVYGRTVIQAADADQYGMKLVIEGGGPMIIGAGEGPMAVIAPNVTTTQESSWLTADSEVNIVSNTNSSWEASKIMTLKTNGDLTVPGNVLENGTALSSTYTPQTRSIATGNGLTGGGNLTANRTLSVSFNGTGTANTVARSDHNHDNIIGVLTNLNTGDKSTIVNALNESNELYNVYKSDFDDNNIAKTVEWKRTNGTLHKKSVLSNPDGNGNYLTSTVTVYNTAGTVAISTRVFNYTYDSNGNLISEVRA